MTQVARESGRNGAIYAQTGVTQIGYSGKSTTKITGGATTTVTLAVEPGWSLTPDAIIDNTMHITMITADGLTIERKAVTSYANPTVTHPTFTNTFDIGSTVIIGPVLTPNAAIEYVEGIGYDPYQVYSAAALKNLIVDLPYPGIAIIAADGLTTRTAEVKFVEGKVIVTPALTVSDTVDLAYSYALLSQIGDMRNWKVSATTDVVETTAFGEGWRSKVPTYRSWTGSAQEVQRQVYWWGRLFSNNTTYVKFIRDKAYPNQYWIGRAVLSWDISVDFNSAIIADVKYEGLGPLVATYL